jgi:hypothetical protein
VSSKKRVLIHSIILMLLAAAWGVGGVAASPSSALQLFDLRGKQVDPLAGSDRKATVFVFVRTDCPISNRYAPLLRAISREYSPLGVAFWLVYVDPRQSAQAIEHHLREYDYGFGALRDPKHELVRLTGAQVTPEATVFVPDRSANAKDSGQRLIYRGRIDDQYVAFGVTRPAATTHDLQDILEKVIQGKPLKETTTRAVGCFISDLQ